MLSKDKEFSWFKWPIKAPAKVSPAPVGSIHFSTLKGGQLKTSFSLNNKAPSAPFLIIKKDGPIVKILAAASSRDKDIASSKGNKIEIAALVGKSVGEKALKAGVETISFDRGGFLYHGRVKSLAEGAREAGLKF